MGDKEDEGTAEGEEGEKKKEGKLHNLIFVGMGVGLAAGVGLHAMESSSPTLFGQVVWWLDLLGPTLFIGALKMIIAPLIFASIVAGVTSLPNMRELGSIGYKTILYYLGTTTVAVTIGLVFVLGMAPGTKDASVEVRDQRVAQLTELRAEYAKETGKDALQETAATPTYLQWLANKEGQRQGSGHGHRWQALSGAKERSAGDMFRDDIVKPILMNPFASLSANPPNALGIIFFALLLGIACTVVGERAGPVIRGFHAFNQVIMRITHWLMSLSPFAIACIIAGLVAKNGPGIFKSLGWYVVTVILAILAHVIFLVIVAKVVGKVGPMQLWRGIREAWLIAFSTRSSAATLPVTMRCVIEKLRVRPKVANFTLPLGATMNMDGTALYEGVAVIFLIQIYGGLDDVSITMTMMTTLIIFITAVLASVGAAAVPDAGLVTIDAVLDMFRTSTNVLGDSIGAVVVDRLVGGDEPAEAEAPPEQAEPAAT
ncbi:MAG: dicarboxylate/amino acid:cation symporter [Deltaproteobacteria bacterium]|nr:dicarboxylate/amino acid:cation symporter [Deltaproteobacteria bacterium]